MFIKKKNKKGFSLKPKTCKLKPSSGFALLFAVVASGLLISIAVAIFSISLKELALSSFGRESQMAFYAANTGAECAMYWDIKLGGFAINNVSVPAGSISCGGEVRTVTTNADATSATSLVSFTFGDLCTDIIINKSDPANSGIVKTIMESRGHNTCDTSSPLRVERALRITY